MHICLCVTMIQVDSLAVLAKHALFAKTRIFNEQELYTYFQFSRQGGKPKSDETKRVGKEVKQHLSTEE